jgi:hypothetical protein
MNQNDRGDNSSDFELDIIDSSYSTEDCCWSKEEEERQEEGWWDEQIYDEQLPREFRRLAGTWRRCYCGEHQGDVKFTWEEAGLVSDADAEQLLLALKRKKKINK